jgi:Spy/CpxP family protein refolding chaperone
MKSTRMICGVVSVSLLVGLAIPAFPVAGATRQTTEQKQQMREGLQETVNELNLTDDQKTELKPIFDDAKSKRAAIMSDTSLSADDKKAKMQELRKDTRSKVDGVLTPEQRAQLKAKMEAAKEGQKKPN